MSPEAIGHQHEYIFFIGHDKYQSDQPQLTGAQIKARVADLEPGTVLTLEGHGNDPDQVIADDDVVNLDTDHGPLRFELVPPATFG